MGIIKEEKSLKNMKCGCIVTHIKKLDGRTPRVSIAVDLCATHSADQSIQDAERILEGIDLEAFGG